MTIESDYVDFCNEVHGLEKRAEGYLAQLSEENLLQLRGFVRTEEKAAKGEISRGYTFLTAMLDAEIKDRQFVPSGAFRDAVFTFIADAERANEQLASSLAKLSDVEWVRARPALENWIERGCSEATAYRKVLEMADYERARLAEEHSTPFEMPF
ncbi:MAG: hypothetical protein ACTHJQ_19580 [Rhizobiaceae bacterium]